MHNLNKSSNTIPAPGISYSPLTSEISTIFIIGFPDDFKERELNNIFLFAPGFEGAVLKTINIPLPNSINNPDESQRKQLIGFVKFSKSSEAIYGLEILNGRILDQERGLVLKAEIAKKNLFIKSPACTFVASVNNNTGTVGPLPAVTTTNNLLLNLINNPGTIKKTITTTTINNNNNCNCTISIDEEIPLCSIIPCSIPNCSPATCSSLIPSTKNDRSRFMSITLPGQINPLLISAPSLKLDTVASKIPVITETTVTPSESKLANNSTSEFLLATPTLQAIPKSFQFTATNIMSRSNSNIMSASASATSINCIASTSNQFQDQIHDLDSDLDSDSNLGLDLLSLQKQLIDSPELGKISAIFGENLPCNTLYVGNLPPVASEDELRALFRNCLGYRRLSFRPKCNGPMCFVEFDDIACATTALETLYGTLISCSISSKGGIRLSYSKNPLGLRVVPVQAQNTSNSSNTTANININYESTDSNHQKAIQTIFKHYFNHKHDSTRLPEQGN